MLFCKSEIKYRHELIIIKLVGSWDHYSARWPNHLWKWKFKLSPRSLFLGSELRSGKVHWL